MKAFLVFVAVGLLPLTATAQTPSAAVPARAGTGAGSGQAAVARQVEGILARQCLSCHGPEKKKGGLDLSRRTTALAGGKSGEAIVPGEPDESLLVEKVAEGEMPPKQPLTARTGCRGAGLGRGRCSLRERAAQSPARGADWWSFRPIAAVRLPRSRDSMPAGSARRSMRSSWPGSNARLAAIPTGGPRGFDPPRHV